MYNYSLVDHVWKSWLVKSENASRTTVTFEITLSPPLMSISDREITLVFDDAGQSIDDKIFAECMCLLQSQCVLLIV